MRKFFSISKKQVTVLITMVVLAAVALWYYLAYIPKNELALEEQHFRWLQKTDENIRAKMVGNDTLLANLLQAYASDKSNEKNVENYIKNYSIDASLTAYITDLTDTQKHSQKTSQTNKPDTSSIQFSLGWDSAMNKLIVSASKEDQDIGKRYTVLMKYDFEKFIKPLLIPGLFDHYVVFYDGNYIYEDFHAGLGYNAREEDSLLRTGKAMTGANIMDQKVGGVDYQIFFQPINFFSGRKLIIAGLLSREEIDAAKKQLPAGIIVLSITIAFGILLFLPWIKIYFQGKYDKVNLRDAAESVIVSKLLMSLIVLLFFTYNDPFRPKTEIHSKKVLANNISADFNKEMAFAYTCLGKFDSVMTHDKMFCDIINLGTDSIRFDKTSNNEYVSIFDMVNYNNSLQSSNVLKNLCNGLKYYEINWLDSNGSLRYNWTKSKQNNTPANYKDRDYYKNVVNNNTISPENMPDNPFVLDQIISRTSGTFRTIISKRSLLDSLSDKEHSAKVVALSFAMKSLDSIIMPAGYSFAIIDHTSLVRYHSRPDRNLNERLVDEFSNKEELEDALQGGFQEVFKTKYYEGDYSVLVKPLKDLPYFIVIMSDERFPASVQIENFSFTWGMVILFMIVVALDLLILILVSSRRSLFKKQYFVTSWLWPRAVSRNEYRIAAMGNCVMIIFLLACFQSFDYLSYLFVLLCCIPITTIFINSLFLYKYKAEKNTAYQRYKVRCNRSSLVFLGILNIIAGMSLYSKYYQVLIFEAALAITGFLFFYFHKPKSNNNRAASLQKNGFINAYMLMIFTRLIITSAIPAVFFYVASYNFENNLLARYRQYKYVTQLQQKFPGKLLPDNRDYRSAIYTDGAWIHSLGLVKNTDSCKCISNRNSLSKDQKNTAGLFNSFGFYLEDVSSINNDNFFQSSSDDGYLCFNNFFDSALYGRRGNRLCVSRKSFATAAGGNTIKEHVEISSRNLNYSFPPILLHKGFMFWLVLAVTLWGFYFALREVIKKVFSLNLEQIPLWKDVDKTLHPLLTDQSLAWITVAQPWSWLVSLVKKLKQIKNFNTASRDDYLLDFDNISLPSERSKDSNLQITDDDKYSEWYAMKRKVLESESRFCILLHIENRMDDTKANAVKLECIKKLLEKKKKIIVLSTMHPLQMQEILTSKNDAGEIIQDATTAKLMNSFLNNSTVIALPLTKNDYLPENKDVMHLFLNEETKYTGFLKELRTDLLSQGIETKPKKYREDILTLRVQSLAYNFYMGIWRSLSSDEKFVLYDLAMDGLVNISNTFSVSLLMNKGLIVEEDGRLHIFNRSFRNFIVSSVSDKELAHLQMLHSKHSNWSNLQTPLLLVVLAVFAFLAIAQEGIYSKVIGVISAMAAGIPALLRMLSMFGVQNGKDVKTDQQS